MKNQKINQHLDELTKTLNFKNTRTQALKTKKCVMCTNPNMDFRDQLSIKEYAISGLCQKCQDEFFDTPYNNKDK